MPVSMTVADPRKQAIYGAQRSIWSDGEGCGEGDCGALGFATDEDGPAGCVSSMYATRLQGVEQ